MRRNMTNQDIVVQQTLRPTKQGMFCTFSVQCVPIIPIRPFLIPAIISFCWWKH